jgi:hypothetical protein
MQALRRWIGGLLLYHLVLTSVFLLFGSVLPTTHWSGCLLAFGVPTVQFTWGFTVGLIVGSNRNRRAWYWTSLLLCFIPLWMVRIFCFLAYHFVGLSAAIVCGTVCLAVIVLETYAGILNGIIKHNRCVSE